MKSFSIFHAKLVNSTYSNYNKYRSLLSSKPKVTLLFSNSMEQNWKENISQGFHYTKHKLEFKDFSRKNVKNYDCVVPIKINELVFSNNIPDLVKNNPIPIPSKESVLLCDDKNLFNSELAKRGFSKYIPKMGGKQKYPYILKKKIDVSGENSHIIFNEKDEDLYKAKLKHKDYFTQEMIQGQSEYATHILFKNNKVICSLNIKYAFETDYPIKGKNSNNYTRVTSCPYLKLFSSILQSIGFEGICCFNYKVQDKIPMIIEITQGVDIV